MKWFWRLVPHEHRGKDYRELTAEEMEVRKAWETLRWARKVSGRSMIDCQRCGR